MPDVPVTITPLPGPITEAFDRINAGDSFANANTSNDQTFNKIILGSNITQGRDVNARGVYAGWPAMTPKYMRHRQGRHHEYFGTIARMYVRLGNNVKKSSDYEAFIESFAEKDTQEVARKLMGNDDGSIGGLGYVDFLLQQAGHSIAEKFQVVETLSDNYVAFFFGQQAPIFNYSGVLINTYQDDWAMRMYRLYRDIARGSQLARRGLLFYLRYDSMIVSGALTGFNFNLNAEMEVAVPFTLQMLVKKVHIVYGGLTAPTALPAGDTFKPAGYYLAETKYKSTKPIITGWSGDPITGGQVPIDEPDVAIDDEAQSINVDDMTPEEFAQTTATSDPEPF